jgi:hypothetical protein
MKNLLISRTKKKASLLFINLTDVDLIEKIISLFNAEYFFGECFLDEADVIESDYFRNNDEMRMLYIENRRKHKQLIVCVPKKLLKKFIGISEKFNTTIGGYSGPKSDWELFMTNRELKEYDVSFAINDNYGTSISFNTNKYNYIEMISKIKDLLDSKDDT